MTGVRRIAFWSLDGLRGHPIRWKYRELHKNEKSRASNREALTEILRYAREKVPFYRGVTADTPEAFPVVDKVIMKKNYNAFRSTDYPDSTKLTAVSTSGSSGTPFTALQDKEKIQYHKAGLILQDQEIGWRVGDRWAHMRNWGYGTPASAKECFVKNMVPLDIVNLDDAKLEGIVRTLVRDKRLHIILGYASALERLANYITEKHYEDFDFGIKLIIADSDNLKESTWDLLQRIFRCPVLNRYANIENGIIAITAADDRAFTVNTNQVYLEILKIDSDVSVAEGEMGRVVITDLHNKAMPFIRYDTGDLAIAKKIVDGQCVIIDSLQGREISALRRTDGILLSETNIMGHFKEFTEIGRYQIIQKSAKEYLMLLENAPDSADEKCRAELKKIFGDDAVVSVRHTDSIPCKKSGKFAVTVSEL